MQPITTKGFHFYEGDRKWLARGVTYGPFAPDADGYRYPGAAVLHKDMAAIAASGANAIRLYDLPTESLVEIAAEKGLRLLIDLPWPKHVDVYTNRELRRKSLEMVEASCKKIAAWPNVLGIFIANEISPDLVRWNGRSKVESLLQDMFRLAKRISPGLNVGYSNFPSTEYLKLDFLDFIGFNVYLNDPEVFRAYMVRLRHLYPHLPVLLSECGFDSNSAGEEGGRVLVESLRGAYETGMAGAFVFAWTDEWHTGGHEITQWAFGLVDRNRNPKPAFSEISAIFSTAPQCSRIAPERASVVVATYNGGKTLRECLLSLRELLYPDFEVIVVNDGSTDNTDTILSDFPEVRIITQINLGLSAARNAGIQAATGSIIAFTDSDCVADPDWLFQLVSYIQRYAVDGVGGPNLTPPSNLLTHRAVAQAPGHATHVLLTHEEAEHVPGCNMAFRKQALLRVGGFDPVYRKAGDDVDIIWRLQDEGLRVGFSTAAFVWHYRRPTIGAYLKQQRGYGEADALVMRKHPHRFNERGQSMWRGVIYPSAEVRPLIGSNAVRYGVFGTGGYQCVYEQFAGSWPFYLTSFEWWLGCLVLAIAGAWAPAGLYLAALAALISISVSVLRAARNWPANGKTSPLAFPIVCMLWVLQPIMRGTARYYHWLHTSRNSGIAPAPRSSRPRRYWPHVLEYWSEDGVWRVWVLDEIARRMTTEKWLFSHNDEWEDWDISVPVSWWFKVRIVSAEENHGAAKRLLRLRFRVIPTSLLLLCAILSVTAISVFALRDSEVARWFMALVLGLLWLTYHRADIGRTKIQELVDDVARNFGGYSSTNVENSNLTAANPTKPQTATLLPTDADLGSVRG